MADETSQKEIAALFGTLFEFILGHTGGVPRGTSSEEWMRGCRIEAWELRDRLVALAMEHPFAWRDMQLSATQRRWLGLPRDAGEEG